MPQPAEQKTRAIVGGALIAFAWLLAAAVTIALLKVLPAHQVDDYAGFVVVGGLIAGAVATVAVIVGVIGIRIEWPDAD
jgi:nucleoside permease NupC